MDKAFYRVPYRRLLNKLQIQLLRNKRIYSQMDKLMAFRVLRQGGVGWTSLWSGSSSEDRYIISGLLSASLLMIVCFIGVLFPKRNAGSCKMTQWATDWQMKSCVGKCHSMRVTRHLLDTQIPFYYSLHQHNWNRDTYKWLSLTTWIWHNISQNVMQGNQDIDIIGHFTYTYKGGSI